MMSRIMLIKSYEKCKEDYLLSFHDSSDPPLMVRITVITDDRLGLVQLCSDLSIESRDHDDGQDVQEQKYHQIVAEMNRENV